MKPEITESFRDAIQGLPEFIPTQTKIDYVRRLMRVGFDIIDIGSFVSDKAIPQLKDTSELLKSIDILDSPSEIMVLAANKTGIDKAVSFNKVSWLAFPYSVSPTFLQRNINADSEQALQVIDYALNCCIKTEKKLRVYIAMAFGNPYLDKYNPEIVYQAADALYLKGVKSITLSDINGLAAPELIYRIFNKLKNDYTGIKFGLHLHTTPETHSLKIEAAHAAGCKSFDSVLNGMGGCPMTGYEMLTNLNSTDLFHFFEQKDVKTNINKVELMSASVKNKELFAKIIHK